MNYTYTVKRRISNDIIIIQNETGEFLPLKSIFMYIDESCSISFFNGRNFETIKYYMNMSRRMLKWLKENQPEILI